MNKEQTMMFEFMKEFDAFCSDNEIKYCLSGESLLYGFSYGRIEPKPFFGSVIMTAANCRKFIEAFNAKKPAGRELEYWGNSENYPEYSVRYVNSNTTSFNLLDFLNYKTHGMFIEIQILRNNKQKKGGESIRALERGIIENAYSTTIKAPRKMSKKQAIACDYYKAKCLIKGKLGVRKAVFDYLMKENSKPETTNKGVGGVYRFTNRGKNISEVSQYYFDKLETCEIEGYHFPVPSNTRALIHKMYEDRYSYSEDGDQVIDDTSYAENSIIDVKMPYAEAIKEMGINKTEILELIKSKERIEEINIANRPNNKIFKSDWATVLQTDARFRMWKHYMPLKDEILRLHEEQDWDALEKLFVEYTRELRALKGSNRSFSFDNDILKIYIQLLEIRGDFEEADRVYNQLPKSHFEEIKGN